MSAENLLAQTTHNTTRRALSTLFVVIAIAALCLARPATAGSLLDVPIVGGRMLVANTGYVTATFLGSDAGYFNTLFLDGEAADVPLFDKHSEVGTSINLGSFTAGTELVFRLDVRNTGNRFFTGDASRNVDRIAHALATTTLEQQTYVTIVGFEDLLGGGDLDYNDFTFALRNVIDPPAVPSPSALALLGLGIGLLGWSLHRRSLRR